MEAYIEKNFKSFDPVMFFEATASGMSCERAKSCFEQGIDNLSTNTSKPYNLVSWCMNVKNNSYEILNTDESLIYWTNRENKTAELIKGYTSGRNKRAVYESISSSSSLVHGKTTLVSKMKRKYEPEKRTEGDKLYFNGVSVATKLKNNAEELVKNYHQLNPKQKHIIGMSLNSIVDLSDFSLDSQKQYFFEKEWEQMKKHYYIKSNLVSIKKFSCLDKLNKKLKKFKLVEAYALARKLEVKNLDTPDEVLFKIYAHIIDIYRFHSEALKFRSNDPTELDCLMKIWVGILEPLFPDTSRVRCKWGESVAEHNDFKVDCRLIFFYNDKLVDLSNIEAARYMTAKKTNGDHLKLAIESKDILDYIIKNSNTFDHKRISIPMIQLCNNHCDVTKLYLGDIGLYCIDEFLNLTLPLSPAEFAEQSFDWFQKLFTLRSHVFKLIHVLDGRDGQKSYTSHFSRPQKQEAEPNNYNTWIRGSFYPPTNEDSPLYVPQNLYGVSVESSKKHSSSSNSSVSN